MAGFGKEPTTPARMTPKASGLKPKTAKLTPQGAEMKTKSAE